MNSAPEARSSNLMPLGSLPGSLNRSIKAKRVKWFRRASKISTTACAAMIAMRICQDG
jgi:hypothetical protein